MRGREEKEGKEGRRRRGSKGRKEGCGRRREGRVTKIRKESTINIDIREEEEVGRNGGEAVWGGGEEGGGEVRGIRGVLEDKQDGGRELKMGGGERVEGGEEARQDNRVNGNHGSGRQNGRMESQYSQDTQVGGGDTGQLPKINLNVFL